MKIKRWIRGSLCVALFFLWLLCFKFISPGTTGIIVNLFGDDKGTSAKELGVGMHWIAPWKRIYSFPMYEQNHIWDGKKSFTFQSGEGLSVHADMGISYHLQSGKVHDLFAKYRRGLDEISDIFIRNVARDAINRSASSLRADELYGNGKTKFIESVQEQMRKDLGPQGIIIDRLYLIGTLHFPDQVVAALNAKIEANQRAEQRENELREAKAQADKVIVAAQGEGRAKLIQAESNAIANKMLSESITSELLVLKAIEAWDGKLPTFWGAKLPMPIIEMFNQTKSPYTSQ